MLLSAVTGEGTDALLKEVETRIAASDTLLEFNLSLDAMGIELDLSKHQRIGAPGQ